MTSVPEHQSAEAISGTEYNQAFASKAEALLPVLQEQVIAPRAVVSFEENGTAYFGVRPVDRMSCSELANKSWGKNEEFIVDFGTHLVGSLGFHICADNTMVDAPTRLQLIFGEVPLDVTEDLYPCNTWISTSWLPDEIINVDWLPSKVELPRRHAFRYLRVKVVDTSTKFKAVFKSFHVRAVSAVLNTAVADPPSHLSPLLREIDQISVLTLRNCMQTVFEDGPRRDRRLWLGDLRLQALANYCTFRNYDLVKRCLYLFAAVPREDGSLPACVFEKPVLTAATDYILDYDVLFGSVVLDYAEASGDIETARELWPTVLASTKIAISHVNDKGVFDSQRSDCWKFLDWADGLDYDAGMHGLLIYALKAVNRLALLLDAGPTPFQKLVDKMISAAEPSFFDSSKGVFVSGPEKQVSWASQAWMALALAESQDKERLKQALLIVMKDPKAVKPLTPYLYHHVADALCSVGATTECIALIEEFWGGMARAGADTFWECFDPADPRRSPYGSRQNNSYCHAWSCTPSYLLRVRLAAG